jgi:Transcriptional regulators
VVTILKGNKNYLYLDAKKHIMDMIYKMGPNEKLPSRNTISTELNVARITIDRAVSELIGEGYLYAIDGSGTYVAEINENAQNTHVTSWGVIFPHIDNYIFPELLKGIEDVAHKNNINIIVSSTDNDSAREERCIKNLISSKVKGIIFVPSIYEDSSCNTAYSLLKQSNIPFVFCVRDVKGINAPKVISNDFYGSLMATKHLIEHKQIPIAFISQKRYSTIEQRLQGYISALFEAGIGLQNEYIHIHSDYNEKEAAIAGVNQLMSLDVPPKALVCFNDIIAYNAYNTLKERGLKVPEDITIVGYDDSFICEMMDIKLTSVRYPKYTTGLKAAELLLGILDNRGEEPSTSNYSNNLTILMPELVIRETCGCKKV